MLIKDLQKKELIRPPKWLPDNTVYLTMMGSVAYGVADTASKSDVDLYGICVPPKDMVFPHLAGEIEGFGRQKKRFQNFQEHHVKDPSARGGHGQEYDIDVYNIVKFFHLCMMCNPNIVDSIFTPQRCVLHMNQVGECIRGHRTMFLSKKAWHTFKGYAYSQVHKIKTKNPEGKRVEIVEKFGWDVKFGYHVVRLLNEVEQILTEGDLDLQRNREQLKAIRRGEWTEQQLLDYFDSKERELESLYTRSELPHSPDENKIKRVLLECLELHYETLGPECVVMPDEAVQALKDVQEVLDRVGHLL